jgi:hypothetical protein
MKRAPKTFLLLLIYNAETAINLKAIVITKKGEN